MLESIIQLGETILEGSSLLDTSIRRVETTTKKGEQKFICKFYFDTQKGTLTFDVNEELSQNSANEYLYVGTIGGPNSLQWCTTVVTADYLLTETIPTLLAKDIPEQINHKLQSILENMFVHIDGTHGKYKYFINTTKIGIEEDVNSIFSRVRKEKETTDIKIIQKAVRTEISKLFFNMIKNKFNIKKDLIGLFVMYIDGECIAQTDFYQELLIPELGQKSKKVKEKLSKGICGNCNNVSDFDQNINLGIKYYTTNQIIFASNLDKNYYYRNFGLCSSCYDKLQAGEIYLKDYLKTRLSQFDVYLLPHFIFKTSLNKKHLDGVAENLKNALNRICNYDKIMEFRNELYNQNVSDDLYLINFVFFESSNQATKIKKVIKDLEPSIFDEICFSLAQANEEFRDYYGKFGFDLNGFFHLLPKTKGNKGKYSAQFKQLLEWYTAIFSKKHIDKDSVMGNAVKCARQLLLSKDDNKTVDKDLKMIDVIIKANIALNFLEKMQCVKKYDRKGGGIMELSIKPSVKAFIEKAGYDYEKTGLFILGSLLAEVAYAQKKRTDKKPILNKLNYWGMDRAKVISLSNEIFNKLRQEKILAYNERLFAECMELLAQSQLKLPKKEMLFYILTGYSVTTSCNIKEAQVNKKSSDNIKGVISND